MQEHTVRTGQGSVSVIVYGDQDKPALLTYPDLALNRERFVPHVFHFKLNYSLFAVSTCFGTFVSLFTVHRLILELFEQICHVSKDCSFVQKQLLCCSTTSAFTTSVLLGMRSVAADLSALEWFCHSCFTNGLF